MSATLGVGGDLERLVGRHGICRLSTPRGWDRQGVGRRFFMFPGMSLDDETRAKLRLDLMNRASRSLVLVPNDRMCTEIVEEIDSRLSFPTFKATDIETSKRPFTAANKAVAVVANRYDGIDFPGEECRLLFIEGHPRATNLQEQFIMTRMGANILFNERIQVRVLQAVGRCTRSLEDYSAVVVSGEDLARYLTDRERRQFLHPELQAEISFGIDQSMDVQYSDFTENFDTFLENGDAWEKVNQQIVADRDSVNRKNFPAIEELNKAVMYEIAFQEQLWKGDYQAALGSADRVLGKLMASELKGYRALWHYLAGSAAQLGADDGVSSLQIRASSHFSKAKGAAKSVPWLVRLARHQTDETSPQRDNSAVTRQVEAVEAMLEHLGTLHDRRFAQREKMILDGLRSGDNGPFEEAHKLLGELLGFGADNAETEGAPDPWWIVDTICLVFEDHAGAQPTSTLDVKKARQVSSHPAWIKENVKGSAGAEILPVLVTPVKKVREGAAPHLKGVALWPLEEFRSWAKGAIGVVRELRNSFGEVGNLTWRAEAIAKFEQNGMDAPGLYEKLRGQIASEALEPVN